MTQGTQSLLDWILNLLNDPEAQAAFKADPEGYLEECGFEDVTPQDVQDVLPLVLESNSISDGGATVNFTGGDQAAATLPAPQPGDSSVESVIRQIEHITNNYSSTNIENNNYDNSTNQIFEDINGDITQSFDNDQVIASGDGSQAAGGNAVAATDGGIAAGDDLDIDDSNVVTGNVNDSILAGDVEDSTLIGGNVEDSNVVTGDDNQTGDGSAFGDNNIVGDGNDGNVVGDGNQAVTGDGSQGAFGDGAQAVGGVGNEAIGGVGNQGFIGDGNQAAFGDGNQQVAGVGNAVADEGNASAATSFGSGDATSANLEDVSADDGGAISVGGDARGENTDIDVDNDDGQVNLATGDSEANAAQVDDITVDQSTDQSVDVTQSEDVDVDQDTELDSDIAVN